MFRVLHRSETADLAKDGGGGRGPDEGSEVSVAREDVGVDGADQPGNDSGRSAVDPFADDVGDPTLDEVGPRGSAFDGVDLEPGAALKPFVRRRALVGAAVVEDEARLGALRRGAADRGEEGDAIGVLVARFAAPDDRPVADVERREESRRAVTAVVLGPRLGTARLQGQRRLHAVERRYLALLPCAEYQRLERRRRAEAADVAQLRGEVRISAQRERFDAVRPKPVGMPDPRNREDEAPPQSSILAPHGQGLRQLPHPGVRSRSVAVDRRCQTHEN